MSNVYLQILNIYCKVSSIYSPHPHCEREEAVAEDDEGHEGGVAVVELVGGQPEDVSV